MEENRLAVLYSELINEFMLITILILSYHFLEQSLYFTIVDYIIEKIGHFFVDSKFILKKSVND